MHNSLIAKSIVFIAGSLAASAMAAAPIEKTAPCPTLTRTNFYNGIDLRAFNNLATTTNNLSSSPGWPIQPPSTLRNEGLIQEPLSPQQSINCVLVPPGLKAQIVASELTPGPVGARPMAYPLAFKFDERGRMWVVDAVDYPYTHDSTGMPAGAGIATNAGLPTDRLTGKSRILIFTDTDGDGSLDNFKVFYEGFALANSLEFVKGGIIVMVPPNVYYVPRSTTNPDTAGGAPVIVVQSLGSNSTNYDTHGQPNSLARGIDNWMYGHTGYNNCGNTGAGIANAPGGSTRSGSCGNGNSYRFKHSLFGSDTSRFEVRSGGLANAHGIGFMEDGQLFKSAATGSTHNQHDVRPGTTALDVRFASGGSGSTDRTRLYSMTNDRYMWEGNNTVISANVNSGNVTYYSSGISAVSGSDFYTARLLPQKYWNRFQFACEGMSGLCNQDSLVVNGSSWLSHRLYPGNRWPNIFASSDAWSAPLRVHTGPDGALWVLDFYYYVFLHNPASPATNSAYRHPLRYKTRSRFYRILPASGQTDPVLNLTNATTSQLVATFYSTNMLWRMHAQRLLVEKGYSTELGTLLENILTTRRNVDAVDLDAPVVHALWTLHGLKQFEENPTRWNPILKTLLLHPAWTVRRNVLLAMPATAASYEAIREQCAVNDVHPHVRLQAFEALVNAPVSGAVIESMDGLRIDAYTPVASASLTDADSTRMTYLGAAYTAAGAAKVTSVTGAARPGTCPAYLNVVSVQGNPGAQMPYRFNSQVRYETRAGGFDLMKNAELTSGKLLVHDLRGKVVFRSVWDKATLTWSKSQARSLTQPVYFFTFRGNDGKNLNGRVTLTAGF
jgi:putative membrane-bound dehydrogenase-like protein